MVSRNMVKEKVEMLLEKILFNLAYNLSRLTSNDLLRTDSLALQVSECN